MQEVLTGIRFDGGFFKRVAVHGAEDVYQRGFYSFDSNWGVWEIFRWIAK